jgi:hypothetical protein
MRAPQLVRLASIALLLAPAFAEEGDDGCAEVEIQNEGGEPKPDAPADDGGKDTGLAGGKKDHGDTNAPKVVKSLQERINDAIARGVEWLKKKQAEDGSWGPCTFNKHYGEKGPSGNYTNHITGPTSFSVYTLAKCGVELKDKSVQKGMKWLRDRTLQSFDNTGDKSKTNLTTYETASIIMMLEAVYHHSPKVTGTQKKRRYVSENPGEPPAKSPFLKFNKDGQGEKDWKWLHQRVLWLTRDQTISAGKGRTTINGTQNPNGGWRYGQRNGDQDLSATQFVLLGLRAASMAGYPVEKTAPDTYKWALQFIQQQQAGDGSFGYQKGMQWSASMDACGIGGLLICKEQMQLAKQEVPSWVDGAIQKGMAHLDTCFDANQNAGFHEGSPYNYYYLYSVERVGDMTGRNEFNGKNWYVRGAEALLASQAPEGAFSDATCCGPTDTLGTCFALLFLKRATVPTVTITAD